MRRPHSPKVEEIEPEQVEAAPSLEEQIEQLTLEKASLLDQLLRSQADFQNFRKRTQSEKTLLQQFAAEAVVSDLLPVLDNFERTIAALESGATLESLKEGVKAVERQLRTVLESQRLTKIHSLGAMFDPEHHEAIGNDETHDHPEGMITAEVSGGYKMADKVIRPARVRVAKKP